MTYAERERIFSKEYLSIEDFQVLFDLEYQGAAKLMRDIKRRIDIGNRHLRIDIVGKIHTEDYLDAMRIARIERYSKQGENNVSN
jgi:hypothetical protein